MTAPLILEPPKSLDGISPRELMSAERTDDGGEPLPPHGPVRPITVPLPIMDGGDVDTFIALEEDPTDPEWPVVRFDSRGQNQVRCISTVEAAGATGSEAYAEYSTDGAAWATPGADAASVPVTIASTGPHPEPDEGWVRLATAAVGDRLWRGMLRGGDGVVSPAISKFHLQFRQATAVGTTPELPPGITPPAFIRWIPSALELAALLTVNDEAPGTNDLQHNASFPPTWVGDRIAFHCWDNVDSRLSITFCPLVGTELRTSAMMFYIRPTTIPTGGGFHILAIGHRQGGAPGGVDGDTPEITLRTGGAFQVDMDSSTPGLGATVASSILLEAGGEYTVGYVHNGTTLTVYVNGIACGSASCSLGLDWVLSPNLFIGCPHGNFTDRRANQDIGEWLVWDGGLDGTGLPTHAEMLHNHQELRDTLYPELP